MDWGIWGAVLLAAVSFAGGFACKGWLEESEREAQRAAAAGEPLEQLHDHWRG